MQHQEIFYEVADHIATVTLNRPAKLNAWTAVMEQEVRAAMERAEADNDVRVIILTGAGRGFCAGADMSLLNNLAQGAGAGAAQVLRNPGGSAPREGIRDDFQKRYSYFPSLTKPVIAAVNGPAVGLGFILTLYCDLRFASDQARFGTAFARRGLIAEYGMAWLLPRLVGLSAALDLLLSARMVDSVEALRIGLVNRVFPNDQFMDQVRTYAGELGAGVSPRSMRIIKQQIYNAQFQTLGEAFESAEEDMIESLKSEDFKEGVAHFLEKRAPVFTGR